MVVRELGTLEQYIDISPRFQRAIHLRYDLGNPETISRYVPTPSAIEAISGFLEGTASDSTQRAHVLHAAYGSGKSLLAVVLAGLLQKRTELTDELQQFRDSARLIDSSAGEQIQAFLSHEARYLPIVLVGNEGDISTAIPRALTKALLEAGIETRIPTRYEAVFETLDLWQSIYPDTYKAFMLTLKADHKLSLKAFHEALEAHDNNAFEIFTSLYPALTAGATFDPFYGHSVDRILGEVSSVLPTYGYTGLVILWDEFGRYLEGRTAKAFGEEAEMLQTIAEVCNYSGQNQVHMALFAHQELQGYASALPKAYQQEWSRIEGRFRRWNISSDPYISYRLLASALIRSEHLDLTTYIPSQCLRNLVNQTLDFGLFGLLDTEEVEQLVLELWPLHPLAAYALVRLSNRVAQNERTMFTFLATDDTRALRGVLRKAEFSTDTPYFVRPAELWDYFNEAIKADTGTGGAHTIWSGVSHALDKLPKGDHLGEEIIRALGVLLLATDGGTAKPTNALLCWAVGAESSDEQAAVAQALENLRRRKVTIHREIDGFWTFTSGSDIDFERRLQEVLERTNPNRLQLRRLLERIIPPPFTVARRYNQSYAMTRFFTGLYRWPEELSNISWDTYLEQQNNTDGLVVYVLTDSDVGLQDALHNIPPHPRVVLVLPKEPQISLTEILREMFSLQELNNDPLLKQEDDRERIQRELNWLIEDTKTRLQRELSSLIESRTGASIWYNLDDQEYVNSPGQTTRFVSQICSHVFGMTPVLNNEGLNKHAPTMQQTRAAQRVIDVLLSQPPSQQLGLEGRGPDVLACNTLLSVTGILRPDDSGTWIIQRPEGDVALQNIWDLIDNWLEECSQSGASSPETLIQTLTYPPYGIRRGVLPVLFAAVLRSRIRVTTIRQNDRPRHPVNGALITNLINEPTRYTIEVGEWNEQLEMLWNSLMVCFSNHIYEDDYNLEPLSLLKVSMLRWLQSLPRYCRDTEQLSQSSLAFRESIRRAQREPAKFLLVDLPELLTLSSQQNQGSIEDSLGSLMTEVANAYLDLYRRLDSFAIQEFRHMSAAQAQDGETAIHSWLLGIEQELDEKISEFRFGSPRTQAFVDCALQSERQPGMFWNDLSVAITGVHIRDWTDKSEDKFRSMLRDVRSEIEIETQALSAEDSSATAISIRLPASSSLSYRFRTASITQHGQHVLQNLKSTMDIAGRPLASDEKRQIAVNLLRYVMGDSLDD